MDVRSLRLRLRAYKSTAYSTNLWVGGDPSALIATNGRNRFALHKDRSTLSTRFAVLLSFHTYWQPSAFNKSGDNADNWLWFRSVRLVPDFGKITFGAASMTVRLIGLGGCLSDFALPCLGDSDELVIRITDNKHHVCTCQCNKR
jgi:hypothetical protein